MPLVLIAGTVADRPTSKPFPVNGRPRCEVRIRCQDDSCVTIYRVLGHDDQMAELEALLPGDCVCVQGRLEVEGKDGRLTGLFIVAEQILPLRRRSISRLPVRAVR
jgi:hypothetical protein